MLMAHYRARASLYDDYRRKAAFADALGFR